MALELHPVQQPGQRISRYVAPATIDDALRLLAEHAGTARPVAGGTDLLIELERGGRPGTEMLIDLTRIDGAAQISVDDGTIRLGPLVTHNQVVDSEVCRNDATPLAQACLEVGSAQLRNRATVAGNLVTASPANDTISALLVLGASVEIRSVDGVRRVALADFFTGFRTTVLRPGELISEITIARLGDAQRAVFLKLGLRRAQAISVVHLAAMVELVDGAVADASLAIGSVAPTVVLLDDVSARLRGRVLDDPTIDEVAAAAAAAVEPIDDLRATAEYRRALVSTMTARALGSLRDATHRSRWPRDLPLLWGRDFHGVFPAGEHLATDIDDDDSITCILNGSTTTAPSAASTNLLDWLRSAGACGVKEGCAEGECGACTIHLDGAAVMACLVPAGRADGATIVTVEGLQRGGGALHPVQEAFVRCAAVQCGFCTPGFVMAAAMMIEEDPHPSRERVTAGFAGNLCRCTGYGAIHHALEQVGDTR